MSTSNSKLIEEIVKKRGDRRWLSGFAVFGSLLVVPALLPVTKNLNLDADPRQTGARFLAFNLGFLLASFLTSPSLKKFGVRPLAIAGFVFAIASLMVVTLQRAPVSLWLDLVPAAGMGVGAGAIAIACLFALKPWSSRLGARALPRVTELSGFGCIFSCLVGSVSYASGWGRFTPAPIAIGASLCLLLCLGGRTPLAVVEKRSPPPDPRVRQLRSIASFLLLSLLFVQLGSEWSLAGWLPLFLIHRIGSRPSTALLVLGFYFLALLGGRLFVQKAEARFGGRTLAACSAVIALAGCLVLGLATTLVGIFAGLSALGIGFAPPYSIVRNTLDESLHFAPGFFRAIFSVAVTGAMCAAWAFGYVQQFLGIGALPFVPAAGSLLVLVLELLLMFESHLMGERAPLRTGLPPADRRTS